MNSTKAKLHSQQGETLVELLAAILIATLSVSLLLSGIAVSSNINQKAEKADESFYDALTAAENRTHLVNDEIASNPSVRIRENGRTVDIPVQVYGNEGLYTYALKREQGGGSP